MTPIINPIWFYLMSICDKIIFVLFIFILSLTILTFIQAACLLVDNYDIKIIFSKIKKFIITLIILIFLAITIPEKQTIIEMMIASNVTYENVDKVKTSTTELVDYIIEKVEDQKKEKDE